MLAVNYSTLRNSLKKYCDKASSEGEIIVVTRKDEQNVIIMSLDQYNEMMKRINNERYIKMLEKSLKELEDNNVIVKKIDDLEI